MGRVTVAGKYNTQHPMRSNSKYPDRLRKRSVSSVSVRMESLETLRRRQGFNEGTDWLRAAAEFPVHFGTRNQWRRRDED